jgi:hypothetical protein
LWPAFLTALIAPKRARCLSRSAGHGHNNLRRPMSIPPAFGLITGKLRSNLRCFPFLRLRHGLPPSSVRQRTRRAKNGNLSSGIITTPTALCVTNVMVHGPGVKLLDGLAVAKHQWVRDLHLPLPSSSYYPSRTILAPASQFLFVIGLDAGQLGYSLKMEGNGPRRATNPSLHPAQPVGQFRSLINLNFIRGPILCQESSFRIYSVLWYLNLKEVIACHDAA